MSQEYTNYMPEQSFDSNPVSPNILTENSPQAHQLEKIFDDLAKGKYIDEKPESNLFGKLSIFIGTGMASAAALAACGDITPTAIHTEAPTVAPTATIVDARNTPTNAPDATSAPVFLATATSEPLATATAVPQGGEPVTTAAPTATERPATPAPQVTQINTPEGYDPNATAAQKTAPPGYNTPEGTAVQKTAPPGYNTPEGTAVQLPSPTPKTEAPTATAEATATVDAEAEKQAEVQNVLKKLQIDQKYEAYKGNYSIQTINGVETLLVERPDGVLRQDGSKVKMANGTEVWVKGIPTDIDGITIVIDELNDTNLDQRFGIVNKQAYSNLLYQVLARQQNMSVESFKAKIAKDPHIKFAVPYVDGYSSNGGMTIKTQAVDVDLHNFIMNIQLASQNWGLAAIEYPKPDMTQAEKDAFDEKRIWGMKNGAINVGTMSGFFALENGVGKAYSLLYSTGSAKFVGAKSDANINGLTQLLPFGIRLGETTNTKDAIKMLISGISYPKDFDVGIDAFPNTVSQANK